jgi:hypothetical protein
VLRALACLVFAVLAPSIAAAQGRVTGVVKDADGHPVKGATVLARSPNYSPVTVTSDRKGRYAFLGLRGGPWTFTVNAPGFQPAHRQSTTRSMGANAPLDFELEPASELAPPSPLAGLDVRALQRQLASAAELEVEGKLDESIAAYRDLLAKMPALTSVHVQLGVLFERKGDGENAVAAYQAAMKADPLNARARTALDRLARR